MRKRIAAALLALVMTVSLLTAPAGAAAVTQFSDVTDQSTATAIESLRLMGVLDGYGNGTFRPEGKLTRAQFCKMVTYAMNASNELGMYRTVTVFPDVKPSHWAAAYINLAAKGRAIIAGYPDGSFCPDRTVTLGQAVTILVRLLGYKDSEVGGVWPESYLSVGAIAGLTTGLSTDGSAPLTRGQAAKLFLNLLTAEKKDGGTLYTLSDETELLSIDGGTGQLKTSKETYTMVNPVSSSSLVGTRGRVVCAGNKALTFLPSSGTAGNSNAAVVLYEDRSTAGFAELAGNSDYRIYKNGSPATRADLRRYDVATYNAETNSILVCDTRVPVYYEACDPSPAAPTKLQVLGGTELYVLPTARDSVAQFKPGQQMTLLLTADGRVAGAVTSGGVSGNAVGVVSETGGIQLLCGSTTITLAGSAEAKYHGQVVRVSAGSKDQLSLSVLSGGAGGTLDLDTKTLGGRKLAENVMVFDGGKLVGLSSSGRIGESSIRYARVNWAGNVDLIVLDNGDRSGDTVYGRVFTNTNADGTQTLSIETDGKTYGPIKNSTQIPNGAFVAAKLESNGQGGWILAGIETLSKASQVSSDAWIGKTAVNFAGRTYTVPSSVQCYNGDVGEWVTLDQALAYSDAADLYVIDGVVRIIVVRHTA